MKSIEKFLVPISTLFVLIVYQITLAPGVVQIDSGELAAVASTLGIAHPTGYPLFTLLGYLFTKIFFFTSKIYALNLLSSFYTVGAFYFVFKINQILLKNSLIEKPIEKKQKRKTQETQTDNQLISFLALVSALTVAFTRTFWLQSTSVEVYSLHLLLITASIFLFLKAYYSEKNEKYSLEKNNLKHWLIFAFVLGLSFTNHMTSILVLPAFAYFYFTKFGFNKNSWKQILLMLIPFFIALSLYLYLPISASHNPSINWGNPIDWERFKRHIMGWQYQSWIFSSTESASKQFKYFVSIFPIEFAYLGLIIIALGIYQLIKLNKKILFFLLILFLTTVLYSINYDINDIDAYFLLAFISAGLIMTFGFYFAYEKFFKNSIQSKYFLLIIPLLTLFINFEKTNQSDNIQYQQYTKAVLNSTEKNSIVISYLWDFFVSPSYYLQFVEQERKDVAVIDKELVRRSWYFNQIKTNYPEIYKRSANLIQAFLPELAKFERNENYNAQLLEKYYREIVLSFIVNNINDHTIYLTPEMVQNEVQNGWLVIPDSLQLVPDLFLFKVVRDTNYQPLKLKDYEIKFREDKSYYTETLKNLIVTTHINRGLYELKFEKKNEAKELVNKALQINPQIQLPDELSKILFE
ncbi:MAG: DUF2723 domain-containing protein [Ignavibacteria bacterium]|nr:DUF2723 domain-containing protein [Ignavibacteria bacterium]